MLQGLDEFFRQRIAGANFVGERNRDDA